MKKRLLFIAPDHLGFYKVVLFGLKKYSDYDVTLLLSTSFIYKYKNIIERFINVINKHFFKNNIKKAKYIEHYTNIINAFEPFDVLLINRADIFNDKLLQLVTNKSKKSIVVYWDSFDKIKEQKQTMRFFDKCYSFDAKDCQEFNLLKNHNFYFITDNTKIPEYDLFFLGTLDSRFEKLKNIFNSIDSKKIKFGAKLFSKNCKIIKQNTNNNIIFFNKNIEFSESYVYNQNTKVILDLSHDNQIGLSFRPFEAIGLKKKLITTNIKIKDYDFYNENNIFVWENETTKIPNSFFKTPYQDIPEHIYSKYSLENWVNNILRN